MAPLAHIDAGINVGTGGAGVSRQWFQRVDLGPIVSADANAASAAWHALWNVFRTEMPIGGVIGWPTVAEILEDTTGAPVSNLAITVVPATVVGSSTAHWSAGNGARVNWATATVHNRRLIRGATFFASLTADAFDTFGQIGSVVGSGYTTAVNNYIAAMAAANLWHVAWHRPAKGTFVGGVSGHVVGGHVRGEGAWLRSRRH